MFHPTARIAALLAVFFWAAGSSSAQQAQGVKSQDLTFNAYYDTLVIPFSKEVMVELKLNGAQKAMVEKAVSRKVSRTNWIERGKHKREVLKYLTTEQRERLEQLTLQFQGALASFNLPDVSTKLALTPEQKQRMTSIQFLLRAGAQNLNEYEKTLYGPDANRGRFLGQLQRSCDCVAESVLIPAQMIKWRSMQGKPLDPRPTEWD